MFKNIFSLNEVSQIDCQLVGMKAAVLGELANLNITTPNGFVISTAAFNACLWENSLESDLGKFFLETDPNNIESATKKMLLAKQSILDGVFPESLVTEILSFNKQLQTSLVAVRSSSTLEDAAHNSWAGQFQSYLNVDQSSLLAYIKKCWASIFSFQTLLYFHHMKKSSKTNFSFAVIVQTMIKSDVSGIVFTKNPEDQNSNAMLIEALYGLGTGITSGEINTDSYLYDQRSEIILQKNIVEQKQKISYNKSLKENTLERIKASLANKQKISDEKIKELAAISKKLETHFQKPLDIEWTIENNKLFILQARPITS